MEIVTISSCLGLVLFMFFKTGFKAVFDNMLFSKKIVIFI